ncbi:hypothetical protein [Pandoraea pnomenusa]|uniref:hypothetical protein n=1 Tax=Pandoraea pnomenusa TaxID=93220 RepID=UPI001ACE462E|nr:hypothetical protein [Pandoraea pnomenusa]MBN9091689.1 hypothetical protein [Pandoraea pnomenusa]
MTITFGRTPNHAEANRGNPRRKTKSPRGANLAGDDCDSFDSFILETQASQSVAEMYEYPRLFSRVGGVAVLEAHDLKKKIDVNSRAVFGDF